MASRRQKQFDRKYSSYKKYTASEDVNYSSHSSRSSFRSESMTSRSDRRGRSVSSEIIAGSDTRSYPVYITIQDYQPEATDVEGIALEQGQIVEVLDKKNPSSWLVRTKARPPQSGWIPGSYFETPTEYYKQRRRTRELESTSMTMTEDQEALLKRDQVYHDLLRTEEEFVADLRTCVDTYVRVLDDVTVPAEIVREKEKLALNLAELYNFHANVMLKGLNYYADDPGKVGQTFIRLERDFDHHVQFFRDLPSTLELLEQQPFKDFFQKISDKYEAGAHTFAEHLKNVSERITHYQNFFKEFVKYTARANQSSKSMQKALELTMGIPQRVHDLVYTNNILQYPGDTNKLGRLIRHDSFEVAEGDETGKNCYVFLFKNKLMITEKHASSVPTSYTHLASIRLDKYTVSTHVLHEDTIILKPNEPGLPTFSLKPADLASAEYTRKAWMKDITEEQEAYASEREHETETVSEFDVHLSDMRSEFSEYSGSRKSSSYHGPEEGGPPRKKVKSPPAISPTGSSTSIYSGGSSSVDWTTTGTTLEMQGTRVTRTQYGFRTLQESSAKMCLKVTGYPLPDITWYKDDVQLHEGERHTFYADEDGFFALTIDPVQVEDTGRYTCMATNEYGQASTSAFFRVLKVEKEAAPPKFVNALKDRECKEGEVINFECEVEGWPEPELVWLVDDQPLRPSHDFKIEYDGMKAMLEIRDAQPDDTGVYTVKIQNEFGTAESKAELVVVPDPDKNHVAPEFQATIEDVECDEGDEVRFKSVITGDPNPEITWMINGIPLSESEKVRFISEDGICILIIKDVTRHFDGTVTCQGSNRLGTTSCDGRLKVRVPPTPPSFAKPLEDRVVQENAVVSFDVDVLGYPEPAVTFHLKGKELKHGMDGVEIAGADGYYKVIINGCKLDEHDGEIVCRAVNEHGTAESRARLTVEPIEEESRSAPTFLKDIEDQTVKFGVHAVFETTVRGSPNPEVTWFINGQKMDKDTPGVKIEFVNHDHKLTVDSTQFAGTVMCRAENVVGRFETKARLTVIPQEKPKKAPRFTELLSDKTEVKGSTVVFEARLEAEPKPDIKWFLKDVELTSSENVVIRDFDGSVKLELRGIKLEDAGEIRCQATNSEGSAISTAKLGVNRKPFPPSFDQQPKSVTVEKGSEARFEAHADGSPTPTYQWSIDGRKIRDSTEGCRLEMVDGVSVLIIDTNVHSLSSTISVVAENSLGVDETGARLTVEEKKVPKVTKELKDQTIVKGQQAHFEVVIEHAKEVKWYHNGKELTPTTEGVKITEETKYEWKLTIESTTFETGTISVKGVNESGTAESKCEMKVVEKPELSEPLKDINATLAEPIKVEVTAKVAAQFKWMINGQTLEDGKDGVHVTTENGKSTLTIDKAEPSHSGTLTVVTSNEAGTVESTSQITVTPKSAAPQIIEGPKDVNIKEKETAEFKVKIIGYPEPTVKWLINDKLVEETTTTTMSRHETEYTLRVTETTTGHCGTVKVTAENAAGSDSGTAQLTVSASMSPPNFKSQLSDMKVKEDDRMQLDVVLENPQPGTSIKWYNNGKQLVESPGVQMSDQGEGKHRLVIEQVKAEQSGTLSVKASNEVGEIECTAKLVVEKESKKPEFTKTPQNHEVYTDEDSVKFSAVVTGATPITTTWYLNDKKIENTEEMKVKYEEETGKTSIRIYKPQISQSGTVRVTAENAHGKAEATATLKVDRRAEVPKFTSNMDDRQVNEGDTVKYTSTVEGYPEPTVEWLLNGEPVGKHANITVTDDAGKHTIEIKEITPEQAGELSCQASNSSGMKKQNVQLSVKRVGEAPTFAKNLEDRLVTEGEVTLMEAKLNEVKPKPTVTWLRDGKEFTSDDHFQLSHADDGTLLLKIITTKMEDKSRITIKAENYFGSVECSASLGVIKQRPMAKPAFQSDIAPINLTEGDSLQTKLLITGDPPPFVKWYINNQMVCETEDTEIKNADGVYSLTIHGVTADMTGKIKCVAYNKMGEVSTEGPLKVVAPIPVEFETSLCDATCREGDTLKLKAVLLGEPTPVVSWYVNGKKLEESQNIKIHSEKGTYTVTIKDITCDYSGKVVCEAVNEYGKASSEAMLLVLPRGEPPDFLEWLSNVRARKDTKVVHKVVFTGDPKPTLTWYINNKEVTNSKEITIVTDEKTSTLTINNFNPDLHVGEIICKAENDAGEVSCTANMVTYTSEMFSESESEAQAEEVIADDMTLTDDESLREDMVRTPTPVMAPKFITKIKDSKAKRGHEAIFECVVPDTKGVCCKWLKDGKEIELIARIRVQTRTIEGHTTQELIIDDVRPEDAGVYTVIVENTAGRDQCEATLTVLEVLDKLPDRAPEFIVSLQDKTTKTNDKVTFECKVIGEPKPTVTWYHEEKVLEEYAKQVIIESEDGIQRLVINNTEVKHEGKYSCVAENVAGTSRTEATLKVEDALAPSFTKSLTDQSISLGDQLILFCSVKGVPQPTVEFFHESVRLKSSSRISVEHDKANTHWRLLIKEATAEDLGKYHASAKNVAGTAISEATVSEKSVAPVFEQGLKRTSVKENEEIRMEVKVTGTQPEVTWFKDNQPIQQDSVHEIIQDVSTKTYTLVVKEAHRYDAGMYSVKAANAAGSVESTAEVEVTEVLEKPSFVKELVSTEVKINETVKLEVTVKGTPAPEVTWKKEGQPVNIDNTHIISKSDQATGTFSITIASATLEDVGKYTCEATNVAGTAECSANFAVIKDIEAPVFTEKLQPMDVKETESVMLSVTVTGTPTPSVQWFKDDVPVQIDNVHLIAKEEGSGHYVLSIKEARTTDQGSYSCKATNEAGEAKTEATVHVAKESLAPQFTETLRPLEVKETETATLSVTVTGSPEPKITWLKDSVPIQIDDVHFLSKDEGSGHFTLTIKDCKVSDIGSYSCKATNIAGEAKTEANMGVVEELESPHFTDALKPLEVDEGKPAELHCTVVGKPEPEITWLKNGLPIQIDERHIIKKEEEGKHTLVIKDMRAEDVGSYTCQAVNKAGKDETAAEIKVPKYGFEKQKVEEVQPIFIEPLQEAVATEGETVILECRVNEESKPEIRWFKDDKPVEPGPHFVVETTESGKIKLTIHHATKEDIGSYRCEAINKAGKAETQAKLQYAESKQETVTDESEQLREMVAETVTTAAAVETKAGRGPPEFVELLRSCTVTEKQQAVLKCKVKGEPTPKIKWTKDGKEVEMTARVKCDFKDDGTLTLTVEEATQSDAGEYRCYAENELGSAWTEGPIVVTLIGAPVPDGEAPDFLQPVRPVMVNEGETAVLEGKVSGKPKPTVKWYKNGEEIKPSDHFVVESLDDGTQRLTVKSTTMDDLDEYRCSASNEFGDVWSDVTLTVKRKPQEAPSFTKTLVEVSVVEGESATYECKVTGTPEPEIKWFKDKEEISSTDEHFVQTKESDGTARLVIKSTKVKDSGEIRCEATNPAGKARTDAPLTVTLPDEEVAPEFAQDLQACSVNEGELAKFECKVKGTHLAVKWFKDGQELKPGDGIQIESLPDGTNRLIIDKTKMADQGNYRVEATNPAGSMSSKAPLSIQAPETLKIKRPLEDVTVDKGTKILLSVEVEGQPKTIKWYKGSEQVTTTRTTKIEKVSDVVYKLEVENCEMTDAGAYRVVLSTESESVESSCTVTVKDTTAKVQLPSFKKGLNDQAVPKGQSLVLEVEIEGKPKVVKWYKNGDELKDVKAEDMGDGKYRLTIPDFKDSDVGEYSVTAENECGEVESKAKVTLQEPTDGEKTGKPEIVSGLVPTTVKCGETAVFTVKVKGPVKAVKWYKNGKEIPDAKTKDNGDGSYELLIPDAKKEDTADYKVVLSNDAGDADSSAALTVKLPQIEIVKGLQDTTVPQKETGVLEIETNQKPKQVKWYKNGKEIAPSDKPQAKQIDDNKYQLVIPDAEKDDTAEYKVVLTDDDGNEAESSCALTVKLPSGIEIVKGLEDATVPKGQQAVLEVETSKSPKQVKWYKNGKELTPSDKPKAKKISDTKHQLVIPDVAGEDTADYKVVLIDDDGNEADSSCALTVKLPSGIEIVKGLEDATVPKGQQAVLEVETSKAPKQVKWYKNGKELTPSDKPEAKKISDTKHQLVIPDVAGEDTADYKVVLIDDDGNEADSSCALTVKLPSGIEIVKGLEDATVPKGQKAVLEVETSRAPKQVKWYKNGKELTPSDKPEVKKISDTKHQLVIPDAAEDDTADYKVVLTDDDDNSADSFCALTVRLPDKEPKIIKGLDDRTLAAGLPTIWEVETEGSPRTVKWYKNGKELTGATAAQMKISKIDDNHYVLEIPKCAVDDTGDYKIEVENDAGKANSSGKLTVEPQLTFLKPLKDQEITEGQNAEFQVETNAKPRVVKWYKNGQEITPDSRFVVTEDETKFKLVIKNATRDDAAEYKIVLSNTAGDADSSAKLTVKRAKPGVPKIIKGLEDQVVAKGASLVFEVKVEGEVDELRWSKDAAPITAGANAIIEKIDDKTYRLTIPKADLDDAGHYSVEAINESGKAASDAKGEVDEKPEIVKGLNDLEGSEGDDEVFKVEVSVPVRTVKWYKNGQEIKPSVHLEPKKIGPKKYELIINRAELDDAATFKVVLSNAAGECDSSAQLTVTKPNILKMLEGLKDIDVDEGQPLELKVKVEGIPKVVKWYKNGQELAPTDAELKENPETGEYSLLIPQSKKSDGGAYRVTLANDKGEIYSGAVAHVKTVKPKDTGIAANFLSPLEDTEVAEGETLTLKCVVAGEPFPSIVWTKDGVELEKDERVVMRVALDGTATLRIRDARKSDFGQYRITAANEAGSETSSCQVTVKDKGEQPSKPRFIIPLKSCEAEIGENKMFEVKIRGFPKPTLQWLLNEKPIQFDERVTVEDMGAGNYCLTIKDVRDSDFGTLRCIATNDLGKDECQAEFDCSGPRAGREKDDDRYPPRFNVPLWDRRIPINDPLSIECHVDAKPTAEIEWFKDGKKLEASESIEIRNSSDGACRVRIAKFGKEDVGVYMCVAKNPLGVADTRSNYSVEVVEMEEVVEKKEYAPRFNPGLEDKSVNVGQSVRLTCTVDAIPKASIVWYKDGLPLRSGGRHNIIIAEDGTCTLDITETVEGDEGAYRCVASNEHGSINTSCMVTVKVPKAEAKKEGEEPFFTKGLVDVWTDRGETFTLKCCVKGDPFPEIKWFRNGILVRDTVRTTIETSTDGTCSLTVKECTMSDEGIYRCEAENKHGKAKTQATAHIQVSLGKGDVPKLEMGSAPKFVIPLEDQTVTVGSTIDLECKVTGEPMPQVKWSKDGGPIWEDSRYEWDIDEAKGVYHLRITSATVNDEGTYRAVATNESGSATTKSFTRIDDGLLSAQLPQKSTPPRFTIKLGDARAVEGQPLRFECKVEGSPLPELTWHKDGAQIHPSDRVQISMEPDGTARLVIPQCCMDDEGIYRVIATNPSGSAHDKGNAVVKKAPRDFDRRSADRDQFDANKVPKVVEPLENVKIPEKQGFRLRCKFSGEPKLAIKWFKDGERVFPYGRLQLLESPDGVCELIVDSSIRQDAGGYRCVAENAFGSARTTCDVTVIQKEKKPVTDFDATLKEGKAPGFTVPLTIRRAKPGDDVAFECVPYGNPFPQIKWLKDGIEITPSDKIRFESLPDGTQRLHLSSVDFFSEGYFRCVATNEHGTASTKAELCIDGDRNLGSKVVPEVASEPEESKPRIRRGLYNMSIHQGNTVEMIVCATGWPTPTVKWFKNGEEIVPEGPEGRLVTFTDDRGIHHLVLLNVGPEDEGDYSLEATNKLGMARTEGALSVIRPRQVEQYFPDDKGGMPFPPGFVRQLKNKHVFNRMPTIFDCLVVGYPAPEVEWLHNGKKIVPGGRIKIQSCGGGSHALILLDTTVEDAGEYVAVARNIHGTASSSAVLDVTVPYLDNIKFNGEIDVTPYLTEEYGFKKLNYASLPTPPDRGPFIKEVTGHYLTLSWIPTKRAPPRYPQVSYVIEIRELPEKEWTLLDYNIPEPVCKVRNLELGKSYQFRVRAENIYGISDPSPASPPSRLMAPPQPVLDKNKKVIPLLDPYAEKALDLAHAEQYACAPWFAPGVEEKRFCAENDTLSITLNVAGYPDPQIKWKFRGWDIDTTGPTSQCKVYTIGGTETTLLINAFTKDNVGQYQCFATNAYGEAQQNIMVDLAVRPSFIQPLFNRTFSDAQPMRLDVRVEGQPFPEVKWLKEWRPIVESTRVKFVQDGPYLCSLVISDPLWRDSGIYTCIAVNDAGQATTSCSVTVEADGDFNDVELPKKRAMVEARKIREIYEIAEEDET